MTTERDPEPSGVERREAIKRGIAAGVATGVVWSAPKIEGLSLRPSYAAAQSAAATFCIQTQLPSMAFPEPAYTATTSDAAVTSGVLPAKVTDFGAVTISGTPAGGIPGYAQVFSLFNTPGTWAINALTGPAGDTNNWALGTVRADGTAGAGTLAHTLRYNFTTNTPSVAPKFTLSCT